MPLLHTDRQYEEELQQLRAKILEMGGLVEKQISDAMTSLGRAELVPRTGSDCARPHGQLPRRGDG